MRLRQVTGKCPSCQLDWPILGFYCVSWVLYRFILAIGFDTYPLGSFFQYLDIPLLQRDLLTSLWYQHAQPPLMCLIIGLALKLFPVHFALALDGVYLVAGVGAVIFLERGFALLGVRRWVRRVLFFQLCFFPTFYLYSRWLYTPHLEFFCCAWFAYEAIRLCGRERANWRDVARVCFPLCVLGLIRPQWHIILLVAVIMGFWFFRRRQDSWRSYAAALSCFTPLLLVYLKNFVVFGFFGASSWLGINMSMAVAPSVPLSELRALQEEGVIGKAYPVRFAYWTAIARSLRWREAHPGEMEYSHDVLDPMRSDPDKVNFNSFSYLISSRQDLEDSILIIKRFPYRYVRFVYNKFMLMMPRPAISHECCRFSVTSVLGEERPYDSWPSGLLKIASGLTVLQYGLVPLAMFVMALRRRGYVREWRGFIVPGVMFAFVLFVISCALNGWEQERIRWAQAPIYLLLFGMAWEAVIRRYEAAKAHVV